MYRVSGAQCSVLQNNGSGRGFDEPWLTQTTIALGQKYVQLFMKMIISHFINIKKPLGSKVFGSNNDDCLCPASSLDLGVVAVSINAVLLTLTTR